MPIPFAVLLIFSVLALLLLVWRLSSPDGRKLMKDIRESLKYLSKTFDSVKEILETLKK